MTGELPPWISVTRLARDESEAPPRAVSRVGAITWYDADLSRAGDAGAAQDLRRLSPELTQELISDLLAPDEKPEIKDYGTGPKVRKVSAFGVHPSERRDDGSASFDTRDISLVLEQVEFAVG